MKYKLSINLKDKGNICEVCNRDDSRILTKEEAEKIDPLIGQLVAAKTRESVIQILKDLKNKYSIDKSVEKQPHTEDSFDDGNQNQDEQNEIDILFFTVDPALKALPEACRSRQPEKLDIDHLIQFLEEVNEEEKRKKAFYNPFREIFAGESHTYPHARTLRTGLWQKLKDTYFAFSGSFFDQGKEHIGLFDYLTLGLSHYINLETWEILNEPARPLSDMIKYIPLFISFLALNIIRYVAAGIFALAMSPLVIAIHGVAKLISLSRMNDVEHLNIEVGPKSTDSTYNNKTDLSSYLKENNLSLEDLSVDCVGSYRQLTLQFHQELTGASSSLGCCCCEGKEHVIFRREFFLDDQHPKDKKTFKALVELNIGGLARELERKGVSPSFFEKNPSSGNQEKEEAEPEGSTKCTIK